MTIGEQAQQVTTQDGLRLHARITCPPSPKAVFILCHGLATNCEEHGQFRALRDRATRAGFGVVRFDFRAHGASDGTNEDLRLVGLRRDADAIVQLVDQYFPRGVPTIALGVSFGGAAAVHLTRAARPCAGLVLWYAVVDYRWHYAADSVVAFTQRMRAAKSDADPAWADMPILGTGYYLPSGLIDEVAEDPTPKILRTMTQPVLAYYGSRDTLVDIEPLRRIAAAQPNFDVRIAYGAAHGFILWRPWIVRRTVAWASRVVADRSVR